MAQNLTEQFRSIADVTTAIGRGDLTRKVTTAAAGEILELNTTLNTMVGDLGTFSAEMTRITLEYGTQGTQRLCFYF